RLLRQQSLHLWPTRVPQPDLRRRRARGRRRLGLRDRVQSLPARAGGRARYGHPSHRAMGDRAARQRSERDRERCAAAHRQRRQVSGENCGCCGTSAVGLREHADNRPSLSSIVFRVGTFSSFRDAMMRDLVRESDLGALRTRASDDYSITLLELWAVVADVLSFYQERIANEAYLGTATLRESVGRLVRLIDYQLRPALAATARLAFTLERVTAMTIPAALRVQSVPGPNEKPQKFETIESLN